MIVIKAPEWFIVRMYEQLNTIMITALRMQTPLIQRVFGPVNLK
jgi:hypothetical protein